jgi:hypothetical protein
MPFDAVFDARSVEPRQGGGKHQVGNKWPGTITGTRVDETKDKKGGMFVVTLTSAGGSIDTRYNLWNDSEQARNIAKQQLSALCHAIGIFQLNFKVDAAEIRGAKLLYDVGFQAGQEPSAENPAGGYVELKKVYDLQGNDTWNNGGTQQQQTSGFVPPNNNQQQTQQMQPNNQQNNAGGQSMQGGWNNNGGGQQQQQSQPQNNQGGGWNTQQQQPDNNQQQGGWNNGGQQQTPPWKT